MKKQPLNFDTTEINKVNEEIRGKQTTTKPKIRYDFFKRIPTRTTSTPTTSTPSITTTTIKMIQPEGKQNHFQNKHYQSTTGLNDLQLQGIISLLITHDNDFQLRSNRQLLSIIKWHSTIIKLSKGSFSKICCKRTTNMPVDIRVSNNWRSLLTPCIQSKRFENITEIELQYILYDNLMMCYF